MRSYGILLILVLALAGCKPGNIRAGAVGPHRGCDQACPDGRQAASEAATSDPSFRVAGKLVARRVDVGATVKQGDILASPDRDYQNKLLRRKRTSVRRGRAVGRKALKMSRQAVEERLDAEGELRYGIQPARCRGQARRR
jgi:multidrug resistance efflux pump